ncbi:DUF4232 domain-containing protein, partial [Streptomyces sp. NPDC049577]|uniref:DUF4232 domain-containing protein n=1 Tax=Streptomyces sp. NPDC049577 TaxID=3155153 RepID=UPI00343C1EA8
TAAAAPAAPAPGVATCQASGLSAALVDKAPGHQTGMSHEGILLTLTNTTTHPCALRGYPGLQLEDARHQPVETHTTWGSTYFVRDPGRHTVVLDPGRSAEAAMSWAHADAPRMVNAGYLRITPPASRDHLTVAFPKTVTNGHLSVTALARSITVP